MEFTYTYLVSSHRKLGFGKRGVADEECRHSRRAAKHAAKSHLKGIGLDEEVKLVLLEIVNMEIHYNPEI